MMVVGCYSRMIPTLFGVDSMSEQGFEWEGIWITDPTMSECGRFEVNPIEYYGEQYERYAYVAGILHDNKSQKT